MGVFIGVGDEILGFFDIFFEFFEAPTATQRLPDVDQSEVATSDSRCYRPAPALSPALSPAIARRRQRAAPLSPPSRLAIAASAGGSRAVAGDTAGRPGHRPPAPYRPPLAPL